MSKYTVTTVTNASECCLSEYSLTTKKNKVYGVLYYIIETKIDELIVKNKYGLVIENKYFYLTILINYLTTLYVNYECVDDERYLSACVIAFFKCLNIDTTCFMSSEKIISVKCCTPEELTIDCECVNNIPTAIAPLYIYLDASDDPVSVEKSVDVIYKCCNGVSKITGVGLETYPTGITFTNDGEQFVTNTITNDITLDFYAIEAIHTIIDYPFLFCGDTEVIRKIHIIKRCDGANAFTIPPTDVFTATLTTEGDGKAEFDLELTGTCCTSSSLTYQIVGTSFYVTIDVINIVQIGSAITLTITVNRKLIPPLTLVEEFTVIFTYCGIDIEVELLITVEG